MTRASGHEVGTPGDGPACREGERMGQTRGLRSTILLTAAAGLFACHPVGIDDASETDTVITRKAKDYDYQATNGKYYMPDQIADLCKVDPDKFPIGQAGASGDHDLPDLDCNEITHVYDTTILKDIEKHMTDLGYVRVAKEDAATADAALLVGAVSSNNWVAYSWYPWYPYYPYYPYWGWGIYYPYYPTTSIVNYPTGTLTMELVSIKDADPGQQLVPTIWSGTISGLLADGDTTAATR
ncbi:MAG TPA: DUF4136 domain-containing protein, partial [Polyangiaceae bacterium]|nr:DUF4136 domain-containing protein [Polyangiaceae bacterium]